MCPGNRGQTRMFLEYGAVSWISGDTTRWRVAGLQSVYALAWLGWIRTRRFFRRLVESSWLLTGGTIGGAIYFLREIY